MKDFYSIKEFGELLGISRSTIYRMIKSGKIEVIQTEEKGRIIIPASELEKLKTKKG